MKRPRRKPQRVPHLALTLDHYAVLSKRNHLGKMALPIAAYQANEPWLEDAVAELVATGWIFLLDAMVPIPYEGGYIVCDMYLLTDNGEFRCDQYDCFYFDQWESQLNERKV